MLFIQSRQFKSSTNVTMSPSRLLMKILSNVGLSTGPLGAPLVTGDLPDITCHFSAPLTACLSSPHPLSFPMMIFCEMVSKAS